eukprot:scaffold33711_cov54-Attheya_sp.AAC.2
MSCSFSEYSQCSYLSPVATLEPGSSVNGGVTPLFFFATGGSFCSGSIREVWKVVVVQQDADTSSRSGPRGGNEYELVMILLYMRHFLISYR